MCDEMTSTDPEIRPEIHEIIERMSSGNLKNQGYPVVIFIDNSGSRAENHNQEFHILRSFANLEVVIEKSIPIPWIPLELIEIETKLSSIQ